MKKLISAIAVPALFVGAATAGVSAADITIIECRNFENEEITAANPRTITADGDVNGSGGKFTAYIAAAGGGYEIIRTE